ncbi:MAG: hypothetical protein II511_06535 [Bacteroidales bacterium]|nr:hypothetical protein [Bacteroidales bacterium]
MPRRLGVLAEIVILSGRLEVEFVTSHVGQGFYDTFGPVFSKGVFFICFSPKANHLNYEPGVRIVFQILGDFLNLIYAFKLQFRAARSKGYLL